MNKYNKPTTDMKSIDIFLRFYNVLYFKVHTLKHSEAVLYVRKNVKE